MEFIDTHAHLDSIKYAEDREKVIENGKNNNVNYIITMADTMFSAQAAISLANDYPIVYAGVGIHPQEASTYKEGDLDKLAIYTGFDKVVAIGEIGLDYYYENVSREKQKELFIAQLDVAKQCNMPVSIHDRDAHGDILTILKKEGKGLRGSIHCFSGSLEMAKELIKMGFYLGVDGPITFKNARKLPEVIEYVPLDYLLLETDCPYLAPTPMRGKRNEPAYIPYIAEKIAEIKKISLEEVAKVTTENGKNLFKLEKCD